MIRFTLRSARKSVEVRRYRFVSLVLTVAVASTLLVTLTTLYTDGQSQLAVEVSGVPNMVVEPETSLGPVADLSTDDALALKSEEHFWRHNVLNVAPIKQEEGHLDGRTVKVAETWFDRAETIDGNTYRLGVLGFEGWSYSGREPGEGSVVLGAEVSPEREPGDEIELTIGGETRSVEVAGRLETGSFWDRYAFVERSSLRGEDLDEILVSALIKPKDRLAMKAERGGPETLPKEEFEKWYCSPYTSSIAYTIGEVVPYGEVRVLRRVTEVQAGLIEASSSVLWALLALTSVASVIAVFGAEKMYVSSKMGEFGVMSALGGSRWKVIGPGAIEIGFASAAAAPISYLLSRLTVSYVSSAVFGVTFSPDTFLVAMSLAAPFAASSAALFFVRRGLEREVVEVLNDAA